MELDTNTFYAETETGVKLYTNNRTDISQDWAVKHWGIKNARVFLAIDKTGYARWILGVDKEVVLESVDGSWEAFNFRLDAWAIGHGYSQKTGWASIG